MSPSFAVHLRCSPRLVPGFGSLEYLGVFARRRGPETIYRDHRMRGGEGPVTVGDGRKYVLSLGVSPEVVRSKIKIKSKFG